MSPKTLYPRVEAIHFNPNVLKGARNVGLMVPELPHAITRLFRPLPKVQVALFYQPSLRNERLMEGHNELSGAVHPRPALKACGLSDGRAQPGDVPVQDPFTGVDQVDGGRVLLEIKRDENVEVVVGIDPGEFQSLWSALLGEGLCDLLIPAPCLLNLWAVRISRDFYGNNGLTSS